MPRSISAQQKAQIAMLKVQLRAAELGFMVSLPTEASSRYDAIVDDGQALLRAQVKWGGVASSHSKNAVEVDLRKGNNTRLKTRKYSGDEIDLLLVYLAEEDRVLAFGPKVFHNKASVFIRTAPPLNGITKRVLMSEDHVWNG